MPCQACNSPVRGQIDDMIAAGSSVAIIAETSQVPEASIRYHRENHVDVVMLTASYTDPVVVMDAMQTIMQQARDILTLTRENGQHAVALRAIHEMRETQIAMVKLFGQTDMIEGMVRQRWEIFKRAFMGALEQFPEARDAVLKAIDEATGTRQAKLPGPLS